MRKLFLSSLMFLLLSISIFGQNSSASKCPILSVLPSEAAVINGRISIIAILDDGSRYDNGTIKENFAFKEKLNFKWKISPEFEFTTEKPWIADLKNVSGSGELELSVKVEIKGLPLDCKNIVTENIKLGFLRTIYDPAKFDEFGKISISKERKKLDAVASAFKKCEGCSITIILYDQSKNNNQLIQNRIARVSRYLKDKHNIPENSCEFINGGIGEYSTEIWFIPSFANLPNV